MTADPAPPQPAAGQDDPPEPVYAGVQDWVSQHFLPMYRRPLGGEFRWCPQWWQHAEAITRLTALWQSWEAMRLQPGTGTANWLRDYLDHQLPILLGRSGPFAQCGEDEHIDPRIAAAHPPPPGWWDTADDDSDAPQPLPSPRPGQETKPGPGTALPPRRGMAGDQP
jgi:Domain of unknown function (DUF4913)